MYAPADPQTAPAPGSLLALIADDHRIAVCDGDRCPRCDSRDTRPWGGFSGRRRFRCRGCGRTFSTFTATPLHYLKHARRWPGFLACMDDRMSVRRCGRRLGVHSSTAFRWRHRYLADRRRRDTTTVRGRVHMEPYWLAHNEKGRQPATRPPRRRGYPYPSRIPRASLVTVAFLWQDDTASIACASLPGQGSGLWLREVLRAHSGSITELVTVLHLPPTADMRERGARIASRGLGPGAWPPHPTIGRRLRRWLRPFRGVATRHLEHYLQWFRDELARSGGTGSGEPSRSGTLG